MVPFLVCSNPDELRGLAQGGLAHAVSAGGGRRELGLKASSDVCAVCGILFIFLKTTDYSSDSCTQSTTRRDESHLEGAMGCLLCALLQQTPEGCKINLSCNAVHYPNANLLGAREISSHPSRPIRPQLRKAKQELELPNFELRRRKVHTAGRK